jgi:hypothetical protein
VSNVFEFVILLCNCVYELHVFKHVVCILVDIINVIVCITEQAVNCCCERQLTVVDPTRVKYHRERTSINCVEGIFGV